MSTKFNRTSNYMKKTEQLGLHLGEPVIKSHHIIQGSHLVEPMGTIWNFNNG